MRGVKDQVEMKAKSYRRKLQNNAGSTREIKYTILEKQKFSRDEKLDYDMKSPRKKFKNTEGTHGGAKYL